MLKLIGKLRFFTGNCASEAYFLTFLPISFNYWISFFIFAHQF